YEYTNIGDRPHPAYWCAHPLFRYKPGMAVGVPVPLLGEGTSRKLFLPRWSIDHLRVGQVEVSWDRSLTPDVAIWMCNGDLGGYRQIAVEPATASPLLGPGDSLTWWLRIIPSLN
ncbi:MAG TPA: hypothetical protein VHO95_08980, partial [Candidatus Dormibacteraeota bacterium]|nr:hypothetical protein [Candidatus Dormibacteraeota bacterium]